MVEKQITVSIQVHRAQAGTRTFPLIVCKTAVGESEFAALTAQDTEYVQERLTSAVFKQVAQAFTSALKEEFPDGPA